MHGNAEAEPARSRKMLLCNPLRCSRFSPCCSRFALTCSRFSPCCSRFALACSRFSPHALGSSWAALDSWWAALDSPPLALDSPWAAHESLPLPSIHLGPVLIWIELLLICWRLLSLVLGNDSNGRWQRSCYVPLSGSKIPTSSPM